MKVILTVDAPEPVGAYSQAILTEDHWLYCAGQVALDPKTMQMINHTFDAECHQIFQNISAVLRAAEFDFEHIVKLTVFVTDISSAPQVNEAMKSYFIKHFPARSMVQVSRLPKDARIEIEAVAYRA